MKVGKTQAVLYIFEQLYRNRQIRKTDIQNKISISDLAFRRYMQELRAYFANFNEGFEIFYSKNDELYLLRTTSLRYQ